MTRYVPFIYSFQFSDRRKNRYNNHSREKKILQIVKMARSPPDFSVVELSMLSLTMALMISGRCRYMRLSADHQNPIFFTMIFRCYLCINMKTCHSLKMKVAEFSNEISRKQETVMCFERDDVNSAKSNH